MGEAGNIILEADDVDPKDWVYATFKWTPADLLRVFRATYHELCYRGSYANDYPEIWAKFEEVDATEAYWRKGSAELRFSYALKRDISAYARTEEVEVFNGQVRKIVRAGIDCLRQRYKLKVNLMEYVKWLSALRTDDQKCFVLRVFGTNSKWTQKEINAENNKIRKAGGEEKIKTFFSSY